MSELRVDRDLEEEVAELVAQPIEITGVKRLQRFVRLLEQMRPQGRMRLLAVPRAAVRCAKAIGDAADRGDGREIDVWVDRWEHDESRVGRAH